MSGRRLTMARPWPAAAALTAALTLATTPIAIAWLGPNGGARPGVAAFLGMGAASLTITRPHIAWDGEPGLDARWVGLHRGALRRWTPLVRSDRIAWIDLRVPWWLAGLMVLGAGVRIVRAPAGDGCGRCGYDRGGVRICPECGTPRETMT